MLKEALTGKEVKEHSKSKKEKHVLGINRGVRIGTKLKTKRVTNEGNPCLVAD